jgi:hypothetical protein
MVADYIGVTYNNGLAFGIFAVARALSGTTYSESMFTTKTGLPVAPDAPRFSSAEDKPVPDAKSDHPMHFYYDDEGTREIPRTRWITNIEQ